MKIDLEAEKKEILKRYRKLLRLAKKSRDDLDKKQIRKLIKKLTIKDIINHILDKKNVSKKEIYNYCLSLKK